MPYRSHTIDEPHDGKLAGRSEDIKERRHAMNLRQTVLAGGMYLVARQIVGLVVSVFGAVLIVRLIGPRSFGVYSGALAIVFFVISVARMGTDVYLVRRQTVPDRCVYDQAFTLVLIASASAVTLMYLVSPWLGRLIDPRFLPALWALLPTVPFSLLVVPPQAMLERDLNYRAISILDLAGQASYYTVAPILAFAGLGFWAQVAGYWTWQVTYCLMIYRVSGYRPRLAWSGPLLRENLGYGASYSATQWILQARTLVPTVVVGHYLGPLGVGYIALATQVAEMLSFVKNATWRVSIAALAKVQTDYARLRSAQEEAMLLQVLALGPLLDGFALVAPIAVPLMFGSNWTAALIVYPFIASSYLLDAVFSMHASVLFVLRKNRDVALFYVTYTLVFFVASALLVPRFGLIGYGLGQLAALPTYVVMHAALARLMPFSYRRSLPWLIGCIAPPFSVSLPLYWVPLLWLPLVAVVLRREQRTQVAEYAGYLWLKARPKVPRQRSGNLAKDK